MSLGEVRSASSPPRPPGALALVAGITVLVACGPQTMAPLEKPGTTEAAAAPEPLSAAAPPAATAEPSVRFQPAPIVGAPIGPETSVRIESLEGMDRERANAAFARAGAAVRECAGAGTVVHVRMSSDGSVRKVELGPESTLDAMNKKCVVDALSTIDLDDPSTGEHLRTPSRFAAQFVLAW